ncbi:MAG: glucose-1-phosphate adenylyltransferase [Gammaproteobacteria bacterium]|nr:glucose-1-phosphate adenylyltransferase [Gammaproteobacteria bacterium]
MHNSNTHETLVLVLAIGDGKPLLPLTARRTAAALPYAGNYRIIDFALTNCMHSGLRRINVLTQYNALSLQNHLRAGWSIFNTDLGEFVTPVSPPINEHVSIYTGQANALFNNLYILASAPEDTVLLVSGEEIYRMDYAAMVDYHLQHNADVTIAAIDRETALGGSFSAHFAAVDTELTEIVGCAPATPLPPENGAYGPMGVYVFKRHALVEALVRVGAEGTSQLGVIDLIRHEFLGRGRIFSYRFGGEYGRVSQDRYWRMFDNLDDYYDANMDLLNLDPPLDIYQADWPIRTYQQQRPPARTVPGRSCTEGICVNSIVAGGTVIAGGGVSRSVLGNRVYIDDGATVEDSILFLGVTVGEGARVRNAICDRNVQIPPNEKIGLDRERDQARFLVTPGGVVIVPSNYHFDV